MDFSGWGPILLALVWGIVAAVADKKKKKAKAAARANHAEVVENAEEVATPVPASPIAKAEEALASILRMQDEIRQRAHTLPHGKEGINPPTHSTPVTSSAPIHPVLDAPLEPPVDEGSTDFHSIVRTPLAKPSSASESTVPTPPYTASLRAGLPHHAAATSSIPAVLNDQPRRSPLANAPMDVPCSPGEQEERKHLEALRQVAMDPRKAMIAAIILTPHRSRRPWRRY